MKEKKCKTSSDKPRKAGIQKREDFWSPENIEKFSGEYFSACDRRMKSVVTKDGVEEVPDPRPYTLEGLCCYLRISSPTFRKWLKDPDLVGEAARTAHQRIIADRIEGALSGRQHAGFAQFWLKNQDPDNYRDKVEVDHSVSGEAANMFDAWSEMWKASSK